MFIEDDFEQNQNHTLHVLQQYQEVQWLLLPMIKIKQALLQFYKKMSLDDNVPKLIEEGTKEADITQNDVDVF